ncbi:MAG TPA: glycosyltransferase [Anaerolineae bacterium]|nr:glycosyltransferase [Anaerolineae bacterium]
MAKILNQFSESIARGDATSDHVFLLRRWLRELGYQSDIYALHFADDLVDEVLPMRGFRPNSHETHLIYHHAVGADIVDLLVATGLPLVVVYHNITPPEFFANSNPALTRSLVRGREQLHLLAQNAALGLGASHYNELELIEYGFKQTGVLPIVLDPDFYAHETNPVLAEKLAQNGPNLLFVGRISPNKRQEDLVKLLYFYRRIRPNAHLTLVGSSHLRGYRVWLDEFIANEELEDAVTITGHVTLQDMVTYFRSADLFVSMSEHEGFGKFLIESMYFDLPVLAYAAAAVPLTMGDSGVLFHEKNYEALAEIADLLIHDNTLRQKIISKERQRLNTFLASTVKRQFADYLSHLLNISG